MKRRVIHFGYGLPHEQKSLFNRYSILHHHHHTQYLRLLKSLRRSFPVSATSVYISKMQLTKLLSFTLAISPLAVSAAGTIGWALGYNKPDGSCKAQSDYESDMDKLKGVSSLVRTYTSSGCDIAKQIIPAAKSKGFKVLLGMW